MRHTRRYQKHCRFLNLWRSRDFVLLGISFSTCKICFSFCSKKNFAKNEISSNTLVMRWVSRNLGLTYCSYSKFFQTESKSITTSHTVHSRTVSGYYTYCIYVVQYGSSQRRTVVLNCCVRVQFSYNIWRTLAVL